MLLVLTESEDLNGMLSKGIGGRERSWLFDFVGATQETGAGTDSLLNSQDPGISSTASVGSPQGGLGP